MNTCFWLIKWKEWLVKAPPGYKITDPPQKEPIGWVLSPFGEKSIEIHKNIGDEKMEWKNDNHIVKFSSEDGKPHCPICGEAGEYRKGGQSCDCLWYWNEEGLLAATLSETQKQQADGEFYGSFQ